MALEIERKFLLKGIPQFKSNTECLRISQYYGTYKGERMRFRRTVPTSNPSAAFYDMTKKVFIKHGVYDETISIIDKKEYTKRIVTADRYLKKKRYIVPHDLQSGGLKWEIDVMAKPLVFVLAEIETPTDDHDLTIPLFIEELKIMEVTHLSEFSNYSLAVPKR